MAKKDIVEKFENNILSSITNSSMELVNKVKEPIVKDTEEFLIQIAKYPILACQINGYFPLSVKKSDISDRHPKQLRLTFSFFSFPFIYTLLLCIILPSMIVKLSDTKASFVATATKGVVSDGVTLTVLTTLFICYPFVHRFFGMFTAKQMLLFWKKNCCLLETFFRDEFCLSIVTKELKKIKSVSRIAFFGTLSFSLFGTIFFSYMNSLLVSLGLEIVDEKNAILMKTDLSSQLLFTILPMFAFLHSLSITLVIFFPKLYCLCLHIVAEKLKSLSHPLFATFPDIFIVKGKGNYSNLSNEKLTFNSEDEAIIQVLEMYENICKLVKEFNSHFGSRLVGEVIYNMLATLGFTYFIIVWLSEGQYSSSLSQIFPVIMSAGLMYTLGSVGSRLKQKSTEVMDALQDLNPENMSPKVQWKVKMLISRISIHPLQITPGNYFVLNKSCLVSVSESQMTYMV